MRSRAGCRGPFEVRGVRRRKQSSGTERFPRRPRCSPPAIRWSRDRRAAGRKAASQARAGLGRRADGFSFGKSIGPAKAETPVRGRCCPGLAVGTSSEAPAPGQRLEVRAKGPTDFPSGKPSSRRGSKIRSRVALPGPGAQASSEAGRASRKPGSAPGTGRPERQRPCQRARGRPPARHRLARDVALLKRSNARHAFGARGRAGSRGVRGCPARTPNAGFPSQRPDALFFGLELHTTRRRHQTLGYALLCAHISHPRRFMSTV